MDGDADHKKNMKGGDSGEIMGNWETCLAIVLGSPRHAKG